MKLGEVKLIKIILPNKSGNPKNLKKQSQVKTSPTNVVTFAKDFLRAFWKLIYFIVLFVMQVISEKTL